jgi:hypothetical protein
LCEQAASGTAATAGAGRGESRVAIKCTIGRRRPDASLQLQGRNPDRVAVDLGGDFNPQIVVLLDVFNAAIACSFPSASKARYLLCAVNTPYPFFSQFGNYGTLAGVHGCRLLSFLESFHGTHLVHQDAIDVCR